MRYELNLKRTFNNQLLAFPAGDIALIMEKVLLLQSDPTPSGKNKRRVVSYKELVFRIRAGKYRILYTFGENWVCVLAVDRREDVYEGNDLVDASGPAFDLFELPDDTTALAPRPTAADFSFGTTWQPPARPESPLETPITPMLLSKLRIDRRFHAALLRCSTLEALTEAPVPEHVRNKVFDVVATPNYNEVLQQPTLVVPDADDLLRINRGELIEFLLKLDPEQERHVTRAINAGGPVLIKGGPGTGKSTIAIYRVREVLRALQAEGIAKPRILFTTYTNALIASTRQLLEQLLGDESSLITIETADEIARRCLPHHEARQEVYKEDRLRALLMTAFRDAEQEWDADTLQRLASLRGRLSLDYFVQEIEDVIVGRNASNLHAYTQLRRTGRSVPLQRPQRAVMWRLHESVTRQLRASNATTFARQRLRAADRVASGKSSDSFDAVFIDEVQDLQPNIVRLLTGLCRSPDRLMLTADANQSIYGSGFSWTDVHTDLRFRGRTGILRKNYRSTREIGEAATAYLQDAGLEPERTTITHVASGPVPAVRFIRIRDQAALLVHYFRQATRDLRLGFGACAVLVPSETVGQQIARDLERAGIDARFMAPRALDLRSQGVKVITYRSAKGLEFPIVAIAGFTGTLPGAPASEEEALEREALERRALYVAMTRAMRALLVLAPGEGPDGLFTGFHEPLWNLPASMVAPAEVPF